MTWDFCAEPAFQEKLDWIEAFVTDELRPLEHLLPTLSQDTRGRALDPLRDKVRAQGLWAAHLSEEYFCRSTSVLNRFAAAGAPAVAARYDERLKRAVSPGA
jgi:hypothetical protein